MSSSTINRKFDANSAELLEESTIRVPYELMRRNHRAAQRQIEKDFAFLQSSIKSARSSLSDQSALLAHLSSAQARTSTLKRKFSTLQPSSSSTSTSASQSSSSNPLRTRIEQILNPITKFSQDGISDLDPSYRSFSETRKQRWMIEYLLRTGRVETAKVFAKSLSGPGVGNGVGVGEEGKGKETMTNFEDLVDLGLWEECSRIERGLRRGEGVGEALGWCGENRGTLKKMKIHLEFSLRLQEYIELCRQRRTEAALAYARKFLAPWAETHMEEIMKGMALMAFGEGCGVGTYKALYAKSRWEDLASEFKTTFNGIYGIPSQSILALTTSAGLSSLKLSACLPSAPHPTSATTSNTTTPSTALVLPIPSLAASPPIHLLTRPLSDPSVSSISNPSPIHGHPEHAQRNIDCPTCGNEMAVLTKEVPSSHHTISKLVCRISGEVMDDENPPVAFPNGYVYSRKALLHLADGNVNAFVTCPRTGEKCRYSALKKVYIS